MFWRGLITAIKSPHKGASYKLFRDVKSAIDLHFYFTAVQTGLVEALRRPASREELLEKLSVARPDMLDALLDLGRSLGALSLRSGVWSARGRMMRCLMSEDGDGPAAMIEAFVTYYNTLYREFPARLTGGPLSNGLDEIGVIVARVSRMLEPYVVAFLKECLDDRPRRVLDVGCGSAGYLFQVSRMNPGASGVGLEQDPAVADLARANLEAWGIGDRFRIVNQDLRLWNDPAGQDFDALFSFNSVYYFDPQLRIETFRLLNRRLKVGGKLIIINQFQGNGSDCVAANLNVTTCSLEGCWPLPELAETVDQLEESGFRGIKPVRLMPGSHFFGLAAQK